MESDFCKCLGKRIREIRLSRGLKQSTLADLLEMERSNLTRIENGKQRPNDENLEKIAITLDVEVKDLFDFNHLKDTHFLINKIHNFLEKAEHRDIELVYRIISDIEIYKNL